MTSQTIKDFETSLYEQICEEWKAEYTRLKEQEAYVFELRQKLVDMAGGDRMEFGVKVQHVESKGKVDWKAIATEMQASKEIIEKHTGAGGFVCRVTKY